MSQLFNKAILVFEFRTNLHSLNYHPKCYSTEKCRPEFRDLGLRLKKEKYTNKPS